MLAMKCTLLLPDLEAHVLFLQYVSEISVISCLNEELGYDPVVQRNVSDLSNPTKEDSDHRFKYNLQQSMEPYLQHKIACCDSKVWGPGPLTAQIE